MQKSEKRLIEPVKEQRMMRTYLALRLASPPCHCRSAPTLRLPFPFSAPHTADAPSSLRSSYYIFFDSLRYSHSAPPALFVPVRGRFYFHLFTCKAKNHSGLKIELNKPVFGRRIVQIIKQIVYFRRFFGLFPVEK